MGGCVVEWCGTRVALVLCLYFSWNSDHRHLPPYPSRPSSGLTEDGGRRRYEEVGGRREEMRVEGVVRKEEGEKDMKKVGGGEGGGKGEGEWKGREEKKKREDGGRGEEEPYIYIFSKLPIDRPWRLLLVFD